MGPIVPTNQNDMVFWAPAVPSINGYGFLLRSDGTTRGTYPIGFSAWGSAAYFAGSFGLFNQTTTRTSYVPWQTDGTIRGTNGPAGGNSTFAVMVLPGC